MQYIPATKIGEKCKISIWFRFCVARDLTLSRLIDWKFNGKCDIPLNNLSIVSEIFICLKFKIIFIHLLSIIMTFKSFTQLGLLLNLKAFKILRSSFP